eukprot:7474896-Pyramimonas_sp.AAC.1
MAVSLLKVQQRDGEKPIAKRSAEDPIQNDVFQEPAQSPSYSAVETFTLEERERLTQQMMKAQQLQNDAKRKRFDQDSNTAPGYQPMLATTPNKLANTSSMGWPMNNFPPNMTMNMWMPASAQDISQDHLLRPPVA